MVYFAVGGKIQERFELDTFCKPYAYVGLLGATLQTLCLCGPLGASWKRLYKPYAYVGLLGPPGRDFRNLLLMWTSWGLSE